MSQITERFDVFPFDAEPHREFKRDELSLLSPAIPSAPGVEWDPIPPLKVAHFDQAFQDKVFAPPRILWEGDHGRIEWQQMNFRQPMYHRNLDVDELAYQIAGDRTLMTEFGTTELVPGDFVRIPVGVAHDNWGRRESHILWYFPAPIEDVAPVVRHSEALFPPFEGGSRPPSTRCTPIASAVVTATPRCSSRTRCCSWSRCTRNPSGCR